ncbi:MAG: DEDD exnuclease domain-containing protein [Actinomyces sp.]|nr:MAG: DEDD exnuclease domain-containing protein [Actinomyces sp.]
MHQRSLDDLGTPLHEVTFCVVDLETTGGSAADCAITEIGAVKLRGGECLGTYQTLVDPGCAIPPEITVLTGITEAMVRRAPRIGAVLPSFLEFCGDAVVVGHNVRFDVSFLDAALERHGHPRLTNRRLDTLALARRLLAAEVPNCKLATLAERLRLDHRPSHRALDDALATGDLLHALIERASALGVSGLSDLVSLPTIAGHPQAAKLRLTEDLPHAPGVYAMLDARGEILYVGKASDLRSRVRSYFSGDERRKVSQLLRETARIDHRVCHNSLEAAVREIRLIHRHLPRFNRQGTTASRYRYVKLTLGERHPRLSIVRSPRDDGSLYLGPVASTARARRLVEAIHSVSPIRRCTLRSTATPRAGVCTPAQIGVAACPCSGFTPPDEYRRIVTHLVTALTTRPDLLLAPLEARLASLAAAERYEEAAETRDRAAVLSATLRRQRRFERLRAAGRVRFVVDGTWVELDRGLFVGAGACGSTATLDLDPLPPPARSPDPPRLVAAGHWVPGPREADELACVAAWLDEHAHEVRLVDVEGVYADPAVALPSFTPARATPSRRASRRTGLALDTRADRGRRGWRRVA